MKTVPKVYHLKDIWKAYSYTLLAANPEWWGRYKNGVTNSSIYRKYLDAEGRKIIIEVFSYIRFRKIIETYFSLATEAIVKGKRLDLTSGLGHICIRRIERDHKNKKVDFHKTSKQPMVWNEQEQKNVRAKIIYHTDDDYLKVGWHKFARITNETMYELRISKNSSTGTAFNQLLTIANKRDPLLKYKYIYCPLKY